MVLGGYRAIVIGGGVSGLAAAYMLARHGASVDVLEKDSPPPSDPEEAFVQWVRPGATQIRHSHIFLGRLRALLREHYPELLAALLAAGFKELRPLDHPPPTLRNIKPEPGDENLVALAGRRVTFERALYSVVEQHPGVHLRPGCTVEGLLATPTQPPQVCGVFYRTKTGRKQHLRAHFVVDASGRRSQISQWLREIHARPVVEKQEKSGIVYYTRFYELRRDAAEPQPGNDPWVGDWDWIKFALFPAERNVFSITLAVPQTDTALKILHQPGAFDAMVQQIRGLRDWIDPCVSEPLRHAPRPVEAMGGLINRLRSFVYQGRPIALRLFVIGDAAYCTNPLYGRGCTQGFLQAHFVVEALRRANGDWNRAALEFDSMSREQIEPFYHASVVADRDAVRRAEGREPTLLADRLREKFFRDGVAIAMRTDPVVFRAFLRMIQMFETPEQAFSRPEVVGRTLWVMAQGEKFRRRVHWQPPLRREECLDRVQVILRKGLVHTRRA